jgi:nucleotide-binding universal stress UspA family protein
MGPALRALRVLATDGSREAELARTIAIDLAESTNSELHVVTVAPGFPSYDIHNPSVVEQLRERRTSSTSSLRRSSRREVRSPRSISG